MTLCSRHADELLEALKRKGMGHLIDSSPDAVKRNARLWLEGKASRKEVDAYVVAALEINAKAAIYCGAGDFCPLCQVTLVLMNQDTGVMWIDNCTDAVLLLCKVNELA